MRARAREFERDGFSDPRSPSGHDRHPVVETKHIQAHWLTSLPKSALLGRGQGRAAGFDCQLEVAWEAADC